MAQNAIQLLRAKKIDGGEGIYMLVQRTWRSWGTGDESDFRPRCIRGENKGSFFLPLGSTFRSIDLIFECLNYDPKCLKQTDILQASNQSQNREEEVVSGAQPNSHSCKSTAWERG